MCWNAEVSLQSFLLGTVAIGIAYLKGLSIPLTVFGLTVTSMQLVEYFAWSYYENPTVNFYASVAGAFLIGVQPIASMLALPSSIRLSFIGAYLLFCLVLTILNRQPVEYTMKRAENGHLSWGFLQKDLPTLVYTLGYLFFMFVPIYVTQNYGFLALVMGTLGLSLYTYLESNTWGSMWCWIVNYLFVGIAIRQVLIAKP